MPDFSVFISGPPPTHTQQERKISWKYRRTYLDPKAKKDRARLQSELNKALLQPSNETIRYPNGTVKKKAIKDALHMPWNDSVAMEVIFYFATKDKKLWGKPKSTKPDLDNLLKSLLDSLQAVGVVTNDSRFSHITVQKYWCSPDEQGIDIHIHKEGDDNNGSNQTRKK